jgi:hypothetical protein
MISKLRVFALMAITAGLLAAVFAAPAGAGQLVEFQEGPAVAFNGTIPPIPSKPAEEVKEACGSETNTWGSELLTTAPSEIKVKNEWADLIPGGKEMEVSGTVTGVEFSNGDISIDHPFSRDFTFNVLLDEPYWSLARSLGTGPPDGAARNETEFHEIHMEIETGALLHSLPQREGPASGEQWELLKTEPPEPELSQDALEHLEPGYQALVGDRVAMRGRWILDCGHNDFHSELHPLTFMAFGHAEGHKTVAHVLTNPYRVTQLYGTGLSEFNPKNPKGKPFPEAFESSVTALVLHSLTSSTPEPLKLEVGIESTDPFPTPFTVCAPEGVTSKVKTKFGFVRRNGVKLKVAKGGTCSTVSASMKAKKYTLMAPRERQCDMRWAWLSTKIAEALGAETRGNEVEEIKVNATGGTFKITFGSETTAAIAYNASAAEVQTALEALPSLTGNITVTGGPGGKGGGTPYVLTFVGALKETAITPVTTNRTELTGGAKLASVIVLKPGGLLDLRRFILSLIEQKEKVSLEEAGAFSAIEKIESNMALTPETPCLDPISGPAALHGMPTDNSQPLPFYGQLSIGSKK